MVGNLLMEKLLSVAEAAELLGVHRTRINQLIDKGDLAATRIGRAYVIREADLEKVRERPAPGRPPLTDEEKAAREKKRTAKTASVDLPFSPLATTAKPKAGAKTTGVKKAAKKKGGAAK
jgi:excisionase family DNA binding protein